MDFKIFTDLIDALSKIASGFKAITTLTKSERNEYREILKETFLLLDTTLTMIIIRLSEIQRQPSDNDFLREVSELTYFPSWVNAEREFRLCNSLRTAYRETQTISGKLTGIISMEDWSALLQQMQLILAGENQVADFIIQKFWSLSSDAQMANNDKEVITELRDRISMFLQQLNAERRELIKQEIGLYEII
jgi:hypothetical protein